MTLELEHWQDVPRACDRAVPGVGHGHARVMDLSSDVTTLDQQRIECALEDLAARGARILHVGVGNSSLAQRFAARSAHILGLTLSDAEKRHGDALGLPGYRIMVLNKYAPDLAALPAGFDFIVDNNPSNFACCVQHFEDMLTQYARLLVPGGLMLTDRIGMQWAYGPTPMPLRYEDLLTISHTFPFSAQRITDDVFALRRRAER